MKLHSGDAIDLKRYEPAMRHLIDTYIRAEDATKVSAFDDMSLIQLIVERGAGAAVEAMPEGIRKNKEAVAEAIENNVRKLIIDESPINPKYYEKMSELLDALIDQRRQEAWDYQKYLAAIEGLARQVQNPGADGGYRWWAAKQLRSTSIANRPVRPGTRTRRARSSKFSALISTAVSEVRRAPRRRNKSGTPHRRACLV